LKFFSKNIFKKIQKNIFKKIIFEKNFLKNIFPKKGFENKNISQKVQPILPK